MSSPSVSTGGDQRVEASYQRRPTEQMSLGRVFRIRERNAPEVRADFFNIFNRTYLANPSLDGADTTAGAQQRGPAYFGMGLHQPGFSV
jgi:hypothetical protein